MGMNWTELDWTVWIQKQNKKIPFAVIRLSVKKILLLKVLPGFLITAPLSVCVPNVIGALAVWIQNQKKNATCVFFNHVAWILMFCSIYISLLFNYMCMRLPFFPWSMECLRASLLLRLHLCSVLLYLAR